MEKCKHRLPCGYCDIKNKQCETIIDSGKVVTVKSVGINSNCDHDWITTGTSTSGNLQMCTKCGATRTIPNYFKVLY